MEELLMLILEISMWMTLCMFLCLILFVLGFPVGKCIESMTLERRGNPAMEKFCSFMNKFSSLFGFIFVALLIFSILNLGRWVMI